MSSRRSAEGRLLTLPSITLATECVLIGKRKNFMAVQTMRNCVKVMDSEGNARSSRERKEDGKCCNFPVLHAVSGRREKLAHPNPANH